MQFYHQLKLKTRFLLTLILFVGLLFSALTTIVYTNRMATTLKTTQEVMMGNLLDLSTLLELTRLKNQSVQLQDEDLRFFQNTLPQKKYYERGFAFMLNDKGKALAFPGKNDQDLSQTDFFAQFRQLPFHHFEHNNTHTGTQELVYIRYLPDFGMFVGAIALKEDVLTKPIRKVMLLALISVMGALLLFALLANTLANTVLNPIKKINHLLNLMARGNISQKVQLKNQDEIGQIGESVNKILEALRLTSVFAREIEQGNFNHSFQPLSDEDELGKALMDMRESLHRAKTLEDQRKTEDQKRNWATEGMALFAEILRRDNDNMENLAYNIVSQLTDYLNANQAALFTLNDSQANDPYLELKACYAYQRKKFLEKKLGTDEGLIGACYLERETVYLKDIPQDYIRITSGLGEAVPSCLLLVPLMVNEQIFGVLEMASLHELELHQIEFVEKLAQSIASTIGSVKTNAQTALLLKQSQLQQEEMRAQEEEMRQNMEELNATQEEMERKSLEMEGIMSALNKSNYIIIYDLNGHIININESYLNLLQITEKEVLGKHHAEHILFNENQKSSYHEFWKELRAGQVKKQINRISLHGKDYWMEETYGPIIDPQGKTYKIFKVAHDITEKVNQGYKLEEQKKQLTTNLQDLNQARQQVLRKGAEMEGYFTAINHTLACLEYDLEGHIIRINDAYMEYALQFGPITREQLLGRNHREFVIPPDYAKTPDYQHFWEQLKQGQNYTAETEKNINGKKIWLREIYTPVKDENGVVFKIIRFNFDITEQKEMARKLQELQNSAQKNED